MERLNRFVPLILVGIFVALGYALVVSERSRTADNAYWGHCNLRFNQASSVRQQVLNDYAKDAAYKRGRMDAAMAVLVEARGGPNTPATDQAKVDWQAAFREVQIAERNLDDKRNEYPPPKLVDYCKRLKELGIKSKKRPEATAVPKAKGTASPAQAHPSVTP